MKTDHEMIRIMLKNTMKRLVKEREELVTRIRIIDDQQETTARMLAVLNERGAGNAN